MAFSCLGSPIILQGIEFSFQPHSFPDTRVMVIAGAVSMWAAIFSPLLSGVCSRRPVHPAHIVESFTASSRWDCIHKSLQELWVLKRDSWSWVVVLNINYRLDLEEWKWKKKLFFFFIKFATKINFTYFSFSELLPWLPSRLYWTVLSSDDGEWIFFPRLHSPNILPSKLYRVAVTTCLIRTWGLASEPLSSTVNVLAMSYPIPLRKRVEFPSRNETIALTVECCVQQWRNDLSIGLSKNPHGPWAVTINSERHEVHAQ